MADEEKLKIFNTNKWIRERYIATEILGEGSYGYVAKAHKIDEKNHPMSKPYAIKYSDSSIKFSNDLEEEDFKQEASNMNFLGEHKNIVHLVDSVFYKTLKNEEKEDYVCYSILVMECGDTSLEEFIKNNKIRRITFYKIACDGLKALEHMKKNKIGHLDIKASNFIFFEKENLFKLADWAGALKSRKRKNSTSYSNRIQLVTYDHCSPEVVLIIEDHYGDDSTDVKFDFTSADIYSFGMTLFECLGVADKNLKGRQFYLKEICQKENHYKFIEEKFLKPLRQKHIEPDVISILQKMTCFEPEKRCKAEEALKFFESKLFEAEIFEEDISQPTQRFIRTNNSNKSDFAAILPFVFLTIFIGMLNFFIKGNEKSVNFDTCQHFSIGEYLAANYLNITKVNEDLRSFQNQTLLSNEEDLITKIWGLSDKSINFKNMMDISIIFLISLAIYIFFLKIRSKEKTEEIINREKERTNQMTKANYAKEIQKLERENKKLEVLNETLSKEMGKIRTENMEKEFLYQKLNEEMGRLKAENKKNDDLNAKLNKEIENQNQHIQILKMETKTLIMEQKTIIMEKQTLQMELKKIKEEQEEKNKRSWWRNNYL